MLMDDETFYLVRNVPRVLGFIGGSAEKPAPIAEKEVKAILSRLEDGEKKPRPKVLFEPGKVVRVTDRPFADFNGVVEDVNYRKVVCVYQYLSLVELQPLESEFSQVEKA